VAGVSAVAKRKQKTWEPDDQVAVPDADEMDDEQFLKHVDKRHGPEMGVETSLLDHPDRSQAWIGPYRAYHEYLHRTQGVDTFAHEHVWDDDDDD
jgi:hypothetical protein